MKRSFARRVWSMVLVICLVIGMIPTFVTHVEVEANAVSGVDSLTCAGFISNTTRRNYIDTMMKYYINNNSNLQTTLNNGLSVVFMFEGGSDHYDTYKYVDASNTTRLQAVCIVVQLNSSGNAEIVFYSENCSSIPDDANYVTAGNETNGTTTIIDGIYSFYTTNHNSSYAAFQTTCYTGWYNPYSGSTGYSGYCNGINIHTRSSQYCAGASMGWCNSAGCQLIGYGSSSSNEFNSFMKIVAGISFNAYTSTRTKFSSGLGVTKGYYVVDRQLGLLSPDGTEYGSGSLSALYTKADLAGITKFSTNAKANADFGYTSKCTFYPSYCQFKTTQSTPINSEPCKAGNNSSETLETAAADTTYTAIGMYQNTSGNYWYQVKTSSGKTGYIYSGHTTYVKQLTSDVKLSSGATYPNGVVKGKYFVVNGTISSTYNDLKSVAVYVHKGFGTSGTKSTGASATVNGKSYTLNSSSIDNNTAFDTLATGKYTYAISAVYVNYYAKSAQELGTNTGTKYLMTEYFMVIPSSVSQSSCSHSYSTTTIKEASCTATGTQVKSCATCGLITESTVAATGHSYGGWTTVDATCTTDGTKSRTCSICGNVETQTISAAGHDYDLVTHAATCQNCAVYEYTCGSCGDNYSLSADELASGWIDYLPEGLDSSLFDSKTQYRYSDYETMTSYETALDGYTVKSSEWVQSGTKTVNYVNTWNSGFDTSNSLYTKYNNKSSKVSASETATTKTEINSDAVVGYLWFHWCTGSTMYSKETKTGSYTNFHALYSTTYTPSKYDDYDPSDGSYKLSSSTACSNCVWYWPVAVYAQKSTSYNKLFTYERWTDFSDWSDTAATASSTRRVETRTVYQLKEAELGDHVWADGVCSECGVECTHSFTDGSCTVCGKTEDKKEYYLFGYINGGNYACEEDYANMGIYQFVDGKLVATFEQDSYVAVKTGDNVNWYMTKGYPGDDATSATLYSTSITGNESDKLRVPKGRQITFTLIENEDGSLTLSYVAAACSHDWSEGVCGSCGEVCGHRYVNGVCSVCGMKEPVQIVIPSITLTYPSLNFESEIMYNIYYTVDNMNDVVEMGLITFDSNLTDGTIADALDVIPGYVVIGSEYMSHTNGIPAKMLGDALYFKAYAKLSDGSYVYSGTAGYHAVAYAKDRLLNSTSTKTHQLVIAMLNYGAAAQIHFDYKADSLMNSFLTDAQKALVEGYSADMVAGLTAVDSRKVGSFAGTSGAFTYLYPNVVFEGAFAINYYFKPAKVMDGDLTLYYWNLEDYNSAGVLTAANATGRVVMEAGMVAGEYVAAVEGIAAKEIDQTVFVAGVYESGGVSYCTGVIAYSLAAYCQDRIANGTATMQDFAAQTAVYGYYAKVYFA